MRSSFFGLETALRALEAQRGAVEVAAHNVANAQTPGYTRQVARLVPTTPYRTADLQGPTGPGTWGTGVDIAEISRVRDAFLDRQVRAQASLGGRYDAMDKALGEIEAMLNEPGTSGLSASFDAYWKAWQSVGNDPQNLAARRVLLQTAGALGQDLGTLDGQWLSARDDIDRQIQDNVSQFNEISQQIASLNQKIVGLTTAGQNPNDMLDQRDLLVQQLGTIASVQTKENGDGSLDVWMGGVSVVHRFSSDTLQVDTSVVGSISLRWASTGQPPQIAPGDSGSIAGLLDMRNTVIPGYRAQLAAIAQALATQTNTLHEKGAALASATAGTTPPGGDGYDFFDFTAPTVTQPLRLTLDADVAASPQNIAAAQVGKGPGDGTTALDIAGLVDRTGVVGAGSIQDAYRGLVGQVGADRLEARTRSENTQALLQGLDVQRQSVEGVSLDEEMARLVQFQHGYEAAARVFNTVDQMINTVVNGLGLAGR